MAKAPTPLQHAGNTAVRSLQRWGQGHSSQSRPCRPTVSLSSGQSLMMSAGHGNREQTLSLKGDSHQIIPGLDK